MELDGILIGLSFFAAQPEHNFLWKILKCIRVEDFNWYNVISQDESWDEQMKHPFFDKSYYCGEDFVQCIQHPQFILFAKLQAYSPPHTSVDIYNICSIQEFQQSNCAMLLLIYDCYNVEIYTKDASILSSLYQNAIECHYTNVKYITLENYSRTSMNIL